MPSSKTTCIFISLNHPLSQTGVGFNILLGDFIGGEGKTPLDCED